MELLTYIQSDLYRHAGNVRLATFFRFFVRCRSFRYMVWFRMASCRTFVLRILGIYFHERMSKKCSLYIPRQTKIGYGFFIGHPFCIVINPTTVIGNNVNISQFTSIGSNNNSAASIGNNVYIGPNCSIVENVSIGDFSELGAGCVVTKDVDANTTVAGVPAKVISHNNNGRFIKNIWKC